MLGKIVELRVEDAGVFDDVLLLEMLCTIVVSRVEIVVVGGSVLLSPIVPVSEVLLLQVPLHVLDSLLVSELLTPFCVFF